MEEVDRHHIAKERFANEIAKALYHHAHAFHPKVFERIAAEIPKDLRSHPVPEIGRLIAV
jgi:protein required for attachment to host cells